jgi:hypothetical protein
MKPLYSMLERHNRNPCTATGTGTTFVIMGRLPSGIVQPIGVTTQSGLVVAHNTGANQNPAWSRYSDVHCVAVPVV